MSVVTATSQTSTTQATSIPLSGLFGEFKGANVSNTTDAYYAINSTSNVEVCDRYHYIHTSNPEAYNIVYNINTTSGEFTASTDSSKKAVSNYRAYSSNNVQVTHGTTTCAPSSTVTGSVGKYNSAYKGLKSAGSYDNITTCTGGSTYYAYYSSPITLYYPTSSGVSSTSSALYRNEYIGNSGSSISAVFSSSQTSYTSVTSLSISGMLGNYQGVNTIANTATSKLINSNEIVDTDNTTLYVITLGNEDFNVTFNPNTSTLSTPTLCSKDSTTGVVTCSCTPTYYCASTSTKGSLCSISSPTITGHTNTPNAYGYSTSATSHTNSWTPGLLQNITASGTYYAQAYSDPITRTATCSKGTGVSTIGSTTATCQVASSWNGEAQGTSCSATLPTITNSSGYTTLGWYSGTTKVANSAASYTLSGNVTLKAYAGRAKPTTALCTNPTYTGSRQNLISTTTDEAYTFSNYSRIGAGSQNVKATINTDTYWADGTTTDVTFSCSMAKSNTTTSLSAISKTYNGSAQAATGASAKLNSNNNTISGATFTYKYYTNSSCSAGETSTAPTNAGTYYTKATLDGTDNYNSSTSGCAKYTMNGISCSVTVSPTSVTLYGYNTSETTSFSLKFLNSSGNPIRSFSGPTSEDVTVSVSCSPSSMNSFALTKLTHTSTNPTVSGTNGNATIHGKGSNFGTATVTFLINDNSITTTQTGVVSVTQKWCNYHSLGSNASCSMSGYSYSKAKVSITSKGKVTDVSCFKQNSRVYEYGCS